MRTITKLALIWTLSAFSIILIIVLTPKENELAAQATFLGSSIIVSFALTTTITVTYADASCFPWTGYFVIGSCLFFSFVMMGLLATDLSFTLKN
jgi:hypothetical protein